MKELGKSPEQLNRMTIPQLMCLMNKVGETEKKITSIEEFRAFQEEKKREEEAWNKR